MCANYRLLTGAPSIIEVFRALKLPLNFAAGGVPNLEPREDIRITDRAPVVIADPAGGARLGVLPWSWQGPGGKPVFNFRSEGRRFQRGRCLILADGFYEFTGERGAKTKWLFTVTEAPLFALAGYIRERAFTLLTCAPGPDMAPYHDRQAVVLKPGQWADWLSHEANEAQLLAPAPAGTLHVEAVRRGPRPGELDLG